MQHQTILAGIVLLFIGFTSGYLLGINKNATRPLTGMHMMHDGEMMENHHMSMSDMMHDMNASLRGKSGAELEEAFLNEMIIHHEGAVEMTRLLLAGTSRPELIRFGNDIIDAQTEEIEMMKRWREEWYRR